MKKIVLLMAMVFWGQLTFGQAWLSDFDAAKRKASESNKNIVLVFAGSDWCAPCIKLEKEIWESSAFKDFSKDNFVLLKADFPKHKKNRLPKEQQKHNDALAEQYNMQGFFPLVLVLNSKGEVLGKTGYKKLSPEEYINLLNSFEG